MKLARIAASVAALLAASAFGADRLEAEGATSAYYMLKPHAAGLREKTGVELVVMPVGTARAMLDHIDGRTGAAVVTSPLADAVEAARTLAWAEQGRVLASKAQLIYTPLPAVDATGRMLAIVTVGAPPPQFVRAVDYLAATYRTRPTALAQDKR
jgi:hypothetical protein